MPRALKATILGLIIAEGLLIAIAPFIPSILPIPCGFPCTPPDPNMIVFGLMLIGLGLVILGVVLSRQK